MKALFGDVLDALRADDRNFIVLQPRTTASRTEMVRRDGKNKSPELERFGSQVNGDVLLMMRGRAIRLWFASQGFTAPRVRIDNVQPSSFNAKMDVVGTMFRFDQ